MRQAGYAATVVVLGIREAELPEAWSQADTWASTSSSSSKGSRSSSRGVRTPQPVQRKVSYVHVPIVGAVAGGRYPYF